MVPKINVYLPGELADLAVCGYSRLGSRGAMRSLQAGLVTWLSRTFVKPRLATRTLEQQRADLESAGRMGKPPHGTVVESVQMESLAGEWVTPPRADPDRVLMWFFGGGYYMGSPQATRALAARIADAIGCRALVPGYRLCPEHPLAASLADALDWYRWLLRQGILASNVLVGGQSAGGGLAFRMLVALRDAGDQLPAATITISPWTDLACTGQSISARAAADPVFGPAFFDNAVRLVTAGVDPRDAAGSPLYADLSGLPPVLIHCGEDEMLLDDSVRLAERAKDAGVDVTLKVYPGLWHVFHRFGFVPEARSAVTEIGAFARTRLGPSTSAARVSPR